MYSVTLWNSKPGTRDNCITGDDFATLEAAEAAYAAPLEHFAKCVRGGFEVWAQLLGDGVAGGRVRRVRAQRPGYDADDISDGRDEHADQAGMGLGVQARNDALGYGS